MEAAYETLCEHGYGDFSLRTVAAQADKRRGVVHYHHDSKTDLLVSLLDYLIGRVKGRSQDLSNRSAVDRLEDSLEWVAFGPRPFGRDGDTYFTAMFELRHGLLLTAPR